MNQLPGNRVTMKRSEWNFDMTDMMKFDHILINILHARKCVINNKLIFLQIIHLSNNFDYFECFNC